MKNRSIFSYIIIFLAFIYFPIDTAKAESNLSDCLLQASSNQDISLGKPIATERLAYKNKLKIGVLPFYFTDGKINNLSDNDKEDYLYAAKIIESLSNNKIKIDFVFLPSVNSGFNSKDLKNIYIQRGASWAAMDLSTSTWGFVKSIISTSDKTVNFSGLDSIILEGNNEDTSYYIAEAMIFFGKNSNSNSNQVNSEFFRNVITNEGTINNAILLDNHVNPNIIAHELMHNFGLTDLYGTGTGPAYMSLMAGTSARLLNYEKALLGWFQNSNFLCTDFNKFMEQPLDKLVINFSNIDEDSIYLLKITNETAYVFEISHEGKAAYLVAYFIDNESRPPITMFLNPNVNFFNLYDLNDLHNIGKFYNSLEFKILYADKLDKKVVINLIPNKFLESIEAKSYFDNSLKRRDLLLAQVQLDTKSQAETQVKTSTDLATKSSTKNVNLKTTITCSKGKTIKKVTGLSPKCPSGYVKK